MERILLQEAENVKIVEVGGGGKMHTKCANKKGSSKSVRVYRDKSV